MDRPWKASGPVDTNSEYLALLSYLPLNGFRALLRFFWFTFEIQRQLRSSPGLIGYSLRALPLRRVFWTLSVWENEKALQDFVMHVPHSDAIRALLPHMGPTKFTRWKLLGSAIPPKWDDALRRSQREA